MTGIIPNVFRIPLRAEVAKSVDAVDSKSTVERRAGSSPASGTNLEAVPVFAGAASLICGQDLQDADFAD